jgi:hypothetical protein
MADRSVRMPTRPAYLLTKVSHQFVRYLAAVTCVGVTLLASLPARAADVCELGVVTTIPGNDESFHYASVDPVARRLYVARGDGVMSIDLDTLKATPRLFPGKHVHAVVPLPGGRLLFTNGDSNTATPADTSAGTVLRDIPVGDEPNATFTSISGRYGVRSRATVRPQPK